MQVASWPQVEQAKQASKRGACNLRQCIPQSGTLIGRGWRPQSDAAAAQRNSRHAGGQSVEQQPASSDYLPTLPLPASRSLFPAPYCLIDDALRSREWQTTATTTAEQRQRQRHGQRQKQSGGGRYSRGGRRASATYIQFASDRKTRLTDDD